MFHFKKMLFFVSFLRFPMRVTRILQYQFFKYYFLRVICLFINKNTSEFNKNGLHGKGIISVKKEKRKLPSRNKSEKERKQSSFR